MRLFEEYIPNRDVQQKFYLGRGYFEGKRISVDGICPAPLRSSGSAAIHSLVKDVGHFTLVCNLISENHHEDQKLSGLRGRKYEYLKEG